MQCGLLRGTVQRREPSTGTSECGITFQRGTLSGTLLEVFADADYASKATDRRSVSGGLNMCGGASVCWFFTTQNCVTLLTSEAEYVALGDAVKELFLRPIWRFMLPSKVMPRFPVFEDNQCAVQLAQNPVTTQIPSTLTYVIIFFENMSARGISR